MATEPTLPPGRLITIEGIDASGKSTMTARLVGELEQEGVAARILNRQTVTQLVDGYGATHLEQLRELIWDYPEDADTTVVGQDAWIHLLTAWFSAVNNLVVRPALQQGTVLVADSWYHKFVARFSINVGIVRAQETFSQLTQPDMVVWLDTTPEECVRRRSKFRHTESGAWRGEPEGEAGFLTYQSHVREAYTELARTGGWLIIPGGDLGTATGRAAKAVRSLILRDRMAQASEGGIP